MGNRGRPEKKFTKEQVEEALNGSDYLYQAADKLGISYPTFLKVKEDVGLGSVMINNTDVEQHLELEDWDDVDEFIDAMKRTDELCSETVGYDDVYIDINERSAILPWGDWHLGGSHSRHTQLALDTKLFKEHSNIYLVLTGDYCDNFIKSGYGGGVYEQVLPTPKQKQRVEFVVRTLKDKILGIVLGCHDKWMFDNEGFDFAQYLAKKGKGSWMGFNALIHLTVGEQEYPIYVSHKYERWSRDNPAHGLFDAFRNLKQAHIEILFGAHRHVPVIAQQWIRGQWVTCIRNTSYKTTDYHLAHKNLPKSPYYLPCVILDPDEHEVTAFKDVREAIRFL